MAVDGAGDVVDNVETGAAAAPFTATGMKGPLTAVAACLGYKQGDRLPYLRATLYDNGIAIDLSEVDGIIVRVRPKSDTSFVVEGSGTADPNVTGGVIYAWRAGDLSVIGTMYVDVQPTWGTLQATFPDIGYIEIEVSL